MSSSDTNWMVMLVVWLLGRKKKKSKVRIVDVNVILRKVRQQNQC